jgi:hypothetical protein
MSKVKLTKEEKQFILHKIMLELPCSVIDDWKEVQFCSENDLPNTIYVVVLHTVRGEYKIANHSSLFLVIRNQYNNEIVGLIKK